MSKIIKNHFGLVRFLTCWVVELTLCLALAYGGMSIVYMMLSVGAAALTLNAKL